MNLDDEHPELEILKNAQSEGSQQPPRAKMSSRRHNRLVAVQFLYSWELNPGDAIEYALEQFFKEYSLDLEKHVFAEELIRGTLENQTQVDATIEGALKNWRFSRVAKTDLCILRLAVYELLFRNDIPPVTSINEAIELSKLLCEDPSDKFINGVLDSLKNSLLRPLRHPSV